MLNLDTDQLHLVEIARSSGVSYFRAFGLRNGAIVEVTDDVADICGLKKTNTAFQYIGSVGYQIVAILDMLEARTGTFYSLEAPTSLSKIEAETKASKSLSEQHEKLKKEMKRLQHDYDELHLRYENLQSLENSHAEALDQYRVGLSNGSYFTAADVKGLNERIDALLKDIQNLEIMVGEKEAVIDELKVFQDEFAMYFRTDEPRAIQTKIDALDNQVSDLEEKLEAAAKFEEAADELVKAVERLQPALERFSEEHLSLYWPIRVLSDAVKEAKEAQYVRD